MGTLACSDPRTGQSYMLGAVNGTPEQAAAFCEALRPNLDPSIILVPPVELPAKCKCVVPRLYAYASAHQLVAHGMTLLNYKTGKYVKPCWYCRWHSREVQQGVPYVRK